MGRVTGASAISVLVVLAGCSLFLAPPATPGAVGPRPTPESAPATLDPQAKLEYRRCGPGDITARLDDVTTRQHGQWITVLFEMRGDTTCLMPGELGVTALDTSGVVLVASEPSMISTGGYPLERLTSVAGSVFWNNWCRPGATTLGWLAISLGNWQIARVSLRPPDGTEPQPPPCIDPTEPSRLQMMSVP